MFTIVLYTYIYIYTCVYTWFVTETVRTFFHGFGRRQQPTLFYGFRRWFFDGFRRRRKHLFMVSVFVFLLVSVVAGKHLFMVSGAGFLVNSAAAGGSIILERIERFLVVFFVFLGLVSIAVFLMVSVVAGKR